MSNLKSKFTLGVGCLFLTLLLASVSEKITAQTISIECPDGDTHTCYTNEPVTVFKGNGATKVTVIK